MHVKLKILRKFIRESIRAVLNAEDEDDIFDIPDPVKIKKNVFGPDDQETFTKIQNKKITFK
jgi:hypothetical protein